MSPAHAGLSMRQPCRARADKIKRTHQDSLRLKSSETTEIHKAFLSSAKKQTNRKRDHVTFLQFSQQKLKKSLVSFGRLKVADCLTTNIPLFCQWTTCTAQVHTRYHPSDITTRITADTNFLKKPAANIFRGGTFGNALYLSCQNTRPEIHANRMPLKVLFWWEHVSMFVISGFRRCSQETPRSSCVHRQLSTDISGQPLVPTFTVQAVPLKMGVTSRPETSVTTKRRCITSQKTEDRFVASQ